MIAVKANREYTINDTDVQSFVKEGFDVYDDAGNLVAYGAGKTVAYDKHMKLVGDYEKLMDANAELSSKVEALEAEVRKLKARKTTSKKKDEAEEK